MASTWSNLGINLQGTGDNSGTWGQLTNVNLQDFDYAISGVAAITLTGNTTLAFTTNSSSTTYTSEAGRAKILVLSGALSATTVTVTVPNIQKDYAIINNSGASVIISAGGSTTVTIPTSTQAYVYVNGSSSVNFELANFGNFSAITSTVTTENITTANITTANITSLSFTTATGTTATVTNLNVTSLTAVTATTTTENVGNINLISNGVLKIYNTANTQYTGLQVAAGQSTTATFTLPAVDGTNGQAIITNGSKVLSFGNAGITAGKSIALTLVFG
jgi:VCBS repeat-containing protein